MVWGFSTGKRVVWGRVLWIFGISLLKRDCYLGGIPRIQTTNLPLVDISTRDWVCGSE